MKSLTTAVALACLALAVPASASVTNSPPGGTIVPIPIVNYSRGGSEIFGGIPWTSTNATAQGGSVFGYIGAYDFRDNDSFTLTGNFVAITNLTLAPTAEVPEPGSFALIGSGLLLVGALLRRRLRR